MSIRDMINYWCDQKELFLLTPRLESDPVARVLFVSRDLYETIGGFGHQIDERMGRLRAHLEVFMGDNVVTVAMEPFRARDAYMTRLSPAHDEVWEIRDRTHQAFEYSVPLQSQIRSLRLHGNGAPSWARSKPARGVPMGGCWRNADGLVYGQSNAGPA